MNRRMTYLAALVGAVCVFFFVRAFTLPHARIVRNDVIQGVLIGVGLAFVSAQAYARIRARRVNGWTTMFGLGEPGNGMFLRAAHAQLFPGPVNVPQEAMYWWTNTDGAGRALSGGHDYVMHFPPGRLPPNEAFWSLTMGDARNHFVANPLNRYKVGGIAGPGGEAASLSQNADGSVDVFIQNAPPAGHESNWLPAPADDFILWLRVYMPDEAILRGEYAVPAVDKVR